MVAARSDMVQIIKEVYMAYLISMLLILMFDYEDEREEA